MKNFSIFVPAKILCSRKFDKCQEEILMTWFEMDGVFWIFHFQPSRELTVPWIRRLAMADVMLATPAWVAFERCEMAGLATDDKVLEISRW